MLTRDHHLDLGTRCSLWYAEIVNCFKHALPVTHILRRGLTLGFGDCYSDLFVGSHKILSRYMDVLAWGPVRWSPYDVESLKIQIDSYQILERLKLEVGSKIPKIFILTLPMIKA